MVETQNIIYQEGSSSDYYSAWATLTLLDNMAFSYNCSADESNPDICWGCGGSFTLSGSYRKENENIILKIEKVVKEGLTSETESFKNIKEGDEIKSSNFNDKEVIFPSIWRLSANCSRTCGDNVDVEDRKDYVLIKKTN